MTRSKALHVLRLTGLCAAMLLSVALIGVLLLACWAPAIMGAPGGGDHPGRRGWWHRQNPPAVVPRH